MSQTIQLESSVRVAGKTEIAFSRVVAVEAVDSIKVTVHGTDHIDEADSDLQVDVCPGGADVRFFAIVADRYGDATNTLSFKVNTTDATAITLDEPFIIAGAGLVGILGPAPESLFFTSTLAEDASVHILVGRDATPPPVPDTSENSQEDSETEG
jgi:hypothetical protein